MSLRPAGTSTTSTLGAGASAGGVSSGTTTVRNSILLGLADDRIDCSGGSIVDSAVDDTDFTSMGDNVNPGSWNGAWFSALGDGYLHLTGSAPVVLDNVASLQDGDLKTDIDGDIRPPLGYVGADEPD